MKKVGYLIKKYRKQALMTQEDLSQKSGISVGQIVRLERGTTERPELDTINAIAKALNVDAGEFVEASGTPLQNQVEDAAVLIERLNKLISLTKRVYMIKDINTEALEVPNEYIILQRWEHMSGTVVAMRIKKQWIVEDREFQKGDIVLIEKGASLTSPNCKRVPTIVAAKGKKTVLKIYVNENDLKDCVYYGRVIKLIRGMVDNHTNL